MLTEIKINESISDQRQITLYYLKNKEQFLLDYHSTIFLSLYKVTRKEVHIDANNQSVRCLTTDSFPCIIHDNSTNFEGIYEEIYEMLF